MYHKQKITDSVSISEMLAMREQGMSNADIAKRIGCTTSAVVKYIGKQPKEITRANHRGGRSAKLPVAESLPAETQVPDMPKESFAERCERMRGQLHCSETHWTPESDSTTVAEVAKAHGIVLPEEEVVSEPTTSEIAREVLSSLECVPEEKADPKTIHKLSDHIDEMIAVFSPITVGEYIRVRLYELGMVEDAMMIDREGLLAKLSELRKGVVLL